VQDEGSASAQEERRPSKQTLDLALGNTRVRTDRRGGVETREVGKFSGYWKRKSRGREFMGSRPTAMGLPSWHGCEAAGGPLVGLVLFWAVYLVFFGRRCLFWIFLCGKELHYTYG
jgi:hypothetical protein